MRLIYLGAEVPSNRKLLLEQGVRNFGFSYIRAKKRGFPKTKKFSFGDYFPEGSQIIVHPGVSEIDKASPSAAEIEDLMADYQDFVVTNLDEIAAFVEFDAESISPQLAVNQRLFFSQAGPKFWPVWRQELGTKDLLLLAQEYDEVALPSMSALTVPTHQLLGQMRGMAAQHGTLFHGLAVASPEDLSQAPLTTASTLSWASPMMRGETIVWDGTRLVRYPKKMKDQARPRYKAVIEQAGFDYDAVLNDDAKEVTKLAIWSYQRLEENMDKKKPTTNPFTVIEGGKSDVSPPQTDVDNSSELMTGMSGILFGDVDNSTDVVRQPESRVPAPRTASERSFLPVLNVDTKTVVEVGEDGRDTLKDVPVLSSSGTSLRQCNTCFVAANCPAYKPDSECAYSLPVEIKTKDQLVALLNAIIEMQGSRVAFAKFTEDLNGGYPDPNVSQEIDRLFVLVEKLKKLEDNREFVRMTFERQGSAGVLSSIFGDRASVLKELDGGGLTQNQTDQIIQQTIIE